MKILTYRLLIILIGCVSCDYSNMIEEQSIQQEEYSHAVQDENPFLDVVNDINSEASYCDSIELIKNKWSESRSNYWINNIVPQLEIETGIEAACDKGFIGYIYSDSALSNDLIKWSEYFNCN